MSVSQPRFPANHSWNTGKRRQIQVYLSRDSRQTIATAWNCSPQTRVYLSRDSRQTIAVWERRVSSLEVYLSRDSRQTIAGGHIDGELLECISAAIPGKP